MGTSYPTRTNARGIWKLKDITRAKTTIGNYPIDSQSQNALFAGGATPSNVNTVDQVNMTTTGDATDFGDLTTAVKHAACITSNSRLITVGGGTPSATDTMEYVHFKTQGNFADFGNISASTNFCAASGNQTRGFRQGGATPSYTNIIEFVETATLGNMTDFGDLTQTVQEPGAAANPTRCLIFGGYRPSPAFWQNRIEFHEIQTTGSSTDFGDLTKTKGSMGCNNSSKTSALASGGYEGSGVDDYTTNIDKINMGSLGNATVFGTLAVKSGYNANASNTVRSIVAGGGAASPGRTNRIEFCTFQSGGAGTDFGDLTAARSGITGGSNGHGGIETFVPRDPELYSPTGRPVTGDLCVTYGGATDTSGTGTTGTGFIQISSLGNEEVFGTLKSGDGTGCTGLGSFTRGVFGTFTPAQANIDYITFATKGNAADFGDSTNNRFGSSGVSNDTRGVFMGGGTPTRVNVIDYVTMATVGNATDFGDLTAGTAAGAEGASNTRGLMLGGSTPTNVNVIQYITIESTGNATDFGDLSAARQSSGSANSTTRSVIGGGIEPSLVNTMEYVTTGSTGNTTDFGNLSATRRNPGNGLGSNSTRGVFLGGYEPTFVNTIDTIEIASTGNATDFGDMIGAEADAGIASNGHGGLS